VLKFGGVVTTAATTTAANAAKPEGSKPSRKGRHPGRTGLPAHLERVEVVNQVPPEARICPHCGSEMTTVGHQRCEKLDVIPARVIVVVRLDERVACPKDDTMASAMTPPAIVDGGKLGDTLIIEALCDKYIEHQPVERQCTRWHRAGVDIAPQTLGRSVAAAIDLLGPVAKLIEEKTRAPGLLGTDATGIPILDPDAPEGIRSGAMWCWTNASWVTFAYAPSADSNSVRRFLQGDLARTVQCDGTSVLTFLERAGGKRPGCWSHGRRGLAEAARGGDLLALEGVRIIARLFAIERASTLAGENAEERLRRRQQESRPVLDELRAWIDAQRDVIPPKTPLGAGLGYLHRQWKRLLLFLDDGHIELTNNRRERELRRLVLGRRNWLFTWLDEGAERTATVLTVIATCIAHGINPRAYLHLVSRLIVNGLPQSKLRDVLPDRVVVGYPELYLGEGGVVPSLALA
jgi:transposase